MREIKFRGLKKSNKTWAYGWFDKRFSISGALNCRISEYLKTHILEHFVIESSVSQFVGLNDKKGVEIYEGDIVRWDDMTNGKKWRVAVVELYPALQFRIVKINCDFVQSAKEGKVFKFGNFIYKDTHNHLEIIGNIFENPEMLLVSKTIT